MVAAELCGGFTLQEQRTHTSPAGTSSRCQLVATWLAGNCPWLQRTASPRVTLSGTAGNWCEDTSTFASIRTSLKGLLSS